MNSVIDTQDINTLPLALVASFKRFQRIDHCEDDELIFELLQGKIEQLQDNAQITVFESTITLALEAADFVNGSASLPVTPVNTIECQAGDPLVAVDADFRLTVKGLHGIKLYFLTGTWVDGLTLTITSGYSAATLPPQIRQALMMETATIYEYREIYLPNGLQQMPEWQTDVIAGLWKPRL